MKKNLFSILLVVVMTMALVACGTKAPSSPDSEAVETVSEVVENSEAVSETEQAMEAPVDEVVENAESISETESAESASEPETSTEENSEAVSEPENAESVSTPDSEAVVEPEFTVTNLNATKYAIQVVNVRSGPSTDFDKIGSLSTNQEITVNGVCDQTGWFRFDLNGTVAFVSNRYVSDEKVEVAPPASNNSGTGSAASGTGSTASNWADGYPKNQWIDMGEYFFYIANSQAEANQVYGDYMLTHTKGEDCHIYHPDLEVRYPDRRMYIAAYTTRKGNVPVVIISTEANCDVSDPSWFCPTPIWEL